MPTLRHLVDDIGEAAKEEVELADKRWRPRVQEAIKDVTRLKLEKDWTGRKIAVPIKIIGGYPAELEYVLDKTISTEQWISDNIARYLPKIHSWTDTGRTLQDLSVLLKRPEDFSALGQELSVAIESVKSVSGKLQKIAERALLKKELMAIRNDILGVYSFGRLLHGYSNPEINLFWKVIGAVAEPIMNVTIEEPTVLVMAHELAHAYSHVGSDASGSIWSSGFDGTDIYVLEGIAQYYTWAVALHLDKHHFTSFESAYKKKISCQRGPYRIHELWTEVFKLEEFRQAMIEIRSFDNATHEAFVKVLSQTQARIHGKAFKPELFEQLVEQKGELEKAYQRE